jgi:hypothetical protein
LKKKISEFELIENVTSSYRVPDASKDYFVFHRKIVFIEKDCFLAPNKVLVEASNFFPDEEKN